jgi:hypothetical protein
MSTPGVLPWLDVENLVPGDDWKQSIREAMERSRLILLLLSTNSVNKDGFIQKEVRDAVELLERKPPGERFLIPVRLEYCSPRFQQLKNLHWVDLFEDWDKGVARIQAVLELEQMRDKESAATVDKAQSKKNREDASKIITNLPNDIKENLSTYAQWLWRHEYGLFPYSEARKRLPNWTNQAKKEWLSELKIKGVLDSADSENAQFTDVGLELLELI